MECERIQGLFKIKTYVPLVYVFDNDIFTFLGHNYKISQFIDKMLLSSFLVHQNISSIDQIIFSYQNLITTTEFFKSMFTS